VEIVSFLVKVSVLWRDFYLKLFQSCQNLSNFLFVKVILDDLEPSMFEGFISCRSLFLTVVHQLRNEVFDLGGRFFEVYCVHFVSPEHYSSLDFFVVMTFERRVSI
jgi:hypothetical protein